MSFSRMTAVTAATLMVGCVTAPSGTPAYFGDQDYVIANPTLADYCYGPDEYGCPVYGGAFFGFADIDHFRHHHHHDRDFGSHDYAFHMVGHSGWGAMHGWSGAHASAGAHGPSGQGDIQISGGEHGSGAHK
jgi:hypothetical protein